MSKVKQRRSDRKKEIIQQTLVLCEKTPFDEISITDICEAVGISVGGFYHYFQKKSDLLVGFFGLLDDCITEEIAPNLTSDDERENLRLFLIGIARHVNDHGVERAKLLNVLEPNDYDESFKPRPFLTVVNGIVSRGQEKNQFSSQYSSEHYSKLILILIRGIISDWARRNGNYSIVQATADSYELLAGFFI